MQYGTRPLKHGPLIAAILVALSLPAGSVLAADGIAGAWKGTGTVTFKSGAKEQARCKATFNPSGQRAYDVSATCASQSGTVTQTAFVRGAGSNYKGTFYNPEFDTNGNIQLSVNGGSMVARLTSRQGTALIRLSR